MPLLSSLCLLVLLAVLGCSPDARLSRSPFLGVVHPPLPRGVETKAEALVMAPGEEADEALYAFSHVRREGIDYLWLSRLLGRDEGGEPAWEVADAVEIPPLQEQERLMVADCRAGGRTDIAALVRDEEGSTLLTAVRLAWGLDRKGERIVRIDPQGVVCRKIGWEGI